MSRSERLLALLQAFRRHRRPVSGQRLAADMGISLRTLYRDIASLKAQGAAIEGEPGMGYVMRPGFMLPPLMLDATELDALVLGMRLVAERGDASLAQGASSTLAKIASVLPPDLRRQLEGSGLFVGRGPQASASPVDTRLPRQAIRLEHKFEFRYRTPDGRTSQRVVWPFALACFERAHVLMCWCELRQDFRHFRIDRITEATVLAARYPTSKQRLLQEWYRRDPDFHGTLLTETDIDPD